MSLSEPTLDVLRAFFHSPLGRIAAGILTDSIQRGETTMADASKLIVDSGADRLRKPENIAAIAEMRANPKLTEQAIAGFLGMM